MFTIALAWINAKYKYKYELLFAGTVLVDVLFISAVVGIVRS